MSDFTLHDLFNAFGSHLLALCLWVEREDGSPGHQVISGCLAAARERWFFLTAGHVLSYLGPLLKAGRIRQVRLADMFTTLASRSWGSVPLDLERRAMLHLDSDDLGVDFGVIHLGAHTRRLLDKVGASPLVEGSDEGPVCDRHYLLGIPADKVKAHTPDRLSFWPTLVSIDKLPEDQVPVELRRPTPRFFGRLPANLQLELPGMSGAPIFGVHSASSRYRLVAIQTSVRKPDVIIGCPVAVALGAVGVRLDRIVAGRTNGDTDLNSGRP